LEEMFDIYDEDMKRIGTATRKETHTHGYWHQTFQCHIFSCEDGVPSLLFQMRHPLKDTFPEKLDKSSAGHLLAGESEEDGVRELEEELGLNVSYQDLIPCGTVRMEYIEPGQFIDREFCHVYLYRCDLPLSEYTMQQEEVTGLYWVTIEDYRRLVYGEAAKVHATGVSLDRAGGTEPSVLWVALDDFTPQSPYYYDTLFKKLGELI
jgi:isopentenyldiphosphate isomerase